MRSAWSWAVCAVVLTGPNCHLGWLHEREVELGRGDARDARGLTSRSARWYPLASSASVVSICRAFRLAESAGVERDPLAQDDPLTETSWHSWADVEPLKSSALSAVLALHGFGVGDEPQLSSPT